MLSGAASLNALWAHLIVEELVRNHADYFCLSPGSRNSPLAVAIGRNKKAHSVVHYDERGMGFHALGWARATRRPSVLVCTSGTAVANLMPAVVEASLDMVPLMVLTADRPPELRHTGANQTIDQVKIFGSYVRWFFDLPSPEKNIEPSFVLTTIDQALYRALRVPAGPVHINCMFREPLVAAGPQIDSTFCPPRIKRWEENQRPFTDYGCPSGTLKTQALDKVTDLIGKARMGILVAGRLQSKQEQEAVLKVSRKLNWPTFPDISSGLRLGTTDENVVAYYDLLLLSDEFMSACRPEAVLHFGGVSTSKRWHQFVERASPENYIMVASHPERHDPVHQVAMRIESDIKEFCKCLVKAIGEQENKTQLNWFTSRLNVVSHVLHQTIDEDDALSEPAVARLITQNIRYGSGLFLASSMPIRDMDVYADPHGPRVIVGSNRGASGIDGTIASASGFAQGMCKPVTLLIGDLAFLHDLNSLALVIRHAKPVVIVVINNNGGGIFSFLSFRGVKELFEPFFGTPHGLSFGRAAEMFGLDYYCPNSKESFISSYRSAQEKNCSAIIEIKSDRSKNYKIHKAIERRLIAALKKERSR